MPPRTLLPFPTLGTRLTQAGIEAHAFVGNSIRNSGLSRMHYADAVLHGFGSPADLWHSLRQLVESPPPGRRFAWAYYSGVDALSHVYGPDSDLVQAEYEFFVRAMVDLFVQPLERRVGREVLLLLLADHGQVATPIQPHYQLAQHAGLARRLHLSPTGEARLPYLYLRPGQAAAVDEYIGRSWPGAFTCLEFGPCAERRSVRPRNSVPPGRLQVGRRCADRPRPRLPVVVRQARHAARQTWQPDGRRDVGSLAGGAAGVNAAGAIAPSALALRRCSR